MDLKNLYRDIVNEHNLNPTHKKSIDHPTLTLRGINPSCGDDITLQLKVENGIVTDGGFIGEGCAISQASADMMLDQVIGLPEKEAIEKAELFHCMVTGEETDPETLEEKLDESAALQDVAHMPARVKCAMLGWRTMKELLENPGKSETVSS